MALAISIKISERPEGTEGGIFDQWAEFAANSPAQMTFIRLPGTSASGPCAECSQFFGMVHDGSGIVVPVIPVHANCVCRDAIKGIDDISTGEPIETFAKGEWLKAVPDKAERRAILGVRKAALLEAGLPVESLYNRPGRPLSHVKTVDQIARGIKGLPKVRLLALAQKMGRAVRRGATRGELVNLLVDKDVF